MIDACKDAVQLTSVKLRIQLDKEVQECKDVVTEADLTVIAQAVLWMKSFMKSAKGRMKLLLME